MGDHLSDVLLSPVVPIAEPGLLDQSFHALADSNRRAIVARLPRTVPAAVSAVMIET